MSASIEWLEAAQVHPFIAQPGDYVGEHTQEAGDPVTLVLTGFDGDGAAITGSRTDLIDLAHRIIEQTGA